MNRKNIFKILLFIWLFFTFISNIFAFDANLQLDKNETDINDYVKLRLEIHSDEWWEIWISNIVWLENFEIISQSQSQSSSTSMIVVDWKTESKIKTSHNFDLTLKAKNKWDFILWPATLKKDNDEIITNSLELKVTWDNLFINNNHLNIQTSSWWNDLNKIKEQKINNEEKEIEKYENIKKRDFDDKKGITVFVLVLFIILWWFYFILRKNSKIIDNKEDSKQDYNEEVDFEKKPNWIIYPEINDPNFIYKLEQVFKQKLYKKYNIKNIENKTFDEILNEMDDKNEDIEKIILILNKAKYSKIIWDNNILLNLIKNI
jgi:hypothetical protein